MTPMQKALAAAGIRSGECFQLASILDGKIHCATFRHNGKGRKAGREWALLENSFGKNVYLCLNPVPKAQGTRRAKAKDVGRTHALLIDIDPDDGPPELPLQVARDIHARYGGALIDSGRGAQVWAQLHPKIDRRRFLRAVARRFTCLGIKIDPTQDPARLARLPGYTNSRTGRRACLIATS